MSKTVEYKRLKYSILEKINKLPHDRYKLTRNKLPIALGISKETFKMWLYIGIESDRQIPVNHLNAIAHFLNVKIDSLINEAPQIITHKQLEEIQETESREKFNVN